MEVTEDHSLFNANREKIKPSAIDNKTLLEYKEYPEIEESFKFKSLDIIDGLARDAASGKLDTIPSSILCCGIEQLSRFYVEFMKHAKRDIAYTKSLRAGLDFIKTKIQER